MIALKDQVLKMCMQRNAQAQNASNGHAVLLLALPGVAQDLTVNSARSAKVMPAQPSLLLPDMDSNSCFARKLIAQDSIARRSLASEMVARPYLAHKVRNARRGNATTFSSVLGGIVKEPDARQERQRKSSSRK